MRKKIVLVFVVFVLVIAAPAAAQDDDWEFVIGPFQAKIVGENTLNLRVEMQRLDGHYLGFYKPTGLVECESGFVAIFHHPEGLSFHYKPYLGDWGLFETPGDGYYSSGQGWLDRPEKIEPCVRAFVRRLEGR